MRHLNETFALHQKGYSDIDYKKTVEHFAGSSYDTIFNNYINGKSDYEPLLKEAMNYIGCELIQEPSAKFNEHALGIKINEVAGISKVTAVYQDSIADKAGIAINDDLISINDVQIKPDGSGTNFIEWCNYFGNATEKIVFVTNGIVKTAELAPLPNSFYKTVKIRKAINTHEEQRKNFELWSANKF